LFLVETRVFDAFDATFDRNLDVVYGLSVGQTRLVGCTSEGLVNVELRTTVTSLQGQNSLKQLQLLLVLTSPHPTISSFNKFYKICSVGSLISIPRK
jgi:hypothetical protein